MAVTSIEPAMRPAQRRRLQLLWRRWMDGFRRTRERDRNLRHAYVEIVTRGRARQTNELTAADAALLIRRLRRATRRGRAPAYNYVLGTAGRRGFEGLPEVPLGPPGPRLLNGYATALGMSPAALDHFIQTHYAAVGLTRRTDLRTVTDLNRVLWGLKALLRRRLRATTRPRQRAA